MNINKSLQSNGKCLLIYPYQKEEIKKNSIEIKYKNAQIRPQLGLLYLSSAIRSKGFDVFILEQDLIRYNDNDIVTHIKENKYHFIGIYTNYFIKERIKKLISNIKKDSTSIIIVGGPGAIHNKEFIESGCDIVCHNEGENTIAEIIDYIGGKKKIKDIKGISYSENGKIVENERREFIKDLDTIPFPDWNNVNINNYYDYFLPTAKKPYTTMITSRGCPYHCGFCFTHNVLGEKYRLRSVGNVITEIDILVKRHGVKYIAFQDDIFGVDINWTEKFCEEILKKRYNLNWSAILHPLSFKNEKKQILDLLSKSGCDAISLGLQSANGNILKNINRNPTEPNELAQIIKLAKQKGIFTAIEFIFGLPDENEKTIKENIEYCFKSSPHVVNFHIFIPMPLTAIGEKYKNKKVCSLSDRKIEKLIGLAFRKFYLNPKNLFVLFKFLITKNKMWFFNAYKLTGHFINIILNRR